MSNAAEYDGLIGTVNTVYMLADNTHVVLEGADENGFEVSKIDGKVIAESGFSDNIFTFSMVEPEVECEAVIIKASPFFIKELGI